MTLSPGTRKDFLERLKEDLIETDFYEILISTHQIVDIKTSSVNEVVQASKKSLSLLTLERSGLR